MTATSIKIFTYPRTSSSSHQPETKEELFVNFDQDYADVFPSKTHLEDFIQKFMDVIWAGIIDGKKDETQFEIKGFALLGGDDETLDLQYLLVDKENSSEKMSTCQLFLPENPEEYFGSPAAVCGGGVGGSSSSTKNPNEGRRMNDGGEYVDDDDDDYFDDGEEYY